MKKYGALMIRYTFLILALCAFACDKSNYENKKEKKVESKRKFNELTAEEKYILLEKGTERPYSSYVKKKPLKRKILLLF